MFSLATIQGMETTLPSHPYQAEEFANREYALRLIEDRVYEGLFGRRIPQPVVICWGVNGIGKSWFLSHVAEKYRFSPRKRSPGPKRAFSTLVDFRKFSPTPGEWTQLLSTIVMQAADQLGTHIAPAAEALTAFRQAADATSASTSTLDDLARHFAAFFDALTPDFVPILLFDSTEVLAEEYPNDFDWFEEHIVAPLVRYNQTLTIFASRRELRRWRQFEVRRRIVRLELKAFSRKELEEQFKKAQVKDFGLVGNVLYPYAFGHPYMAWHLQQRLEPLRAPDQSFDQQFVASESSEIVNLLDEVARWLLVDMPAELRAQLHIASVLRKFHINSLRYILSELADKAYSDRSDSSFLDLISDMVATNLVRYSSAHQGYIVDATVRRLLNLSLRLQQPVEYQHRQTAALTLYENWIKELPENCGGFFIEALFHIAARAKAAELSLEAAWEQIETLLQKSLDPAKFDLEGANFLVEELQRDTELQEMLSEPLFEEKSFFDLLQRVEAFREQVGNAAS
jgi:hypothetical protein